MGTVQTEGGGLSGLRSLGRLDRNLLATAGGGLSPDDRGFKLAAALTRIGDTDAVILHVFLGTVLVPSAIKSDYLAAVGGAVVLASFLAQVLKRTIKRPRPSVANAEFRSFLEEPDPYSFPSGHTSAAFAMAVATFAVLPFVALIELALAFAIAASRIATGAHYPLDVLAGIGVGAGVAIAWTQWFGVLVGG